MRHGPEMGTVALVVDQENPQALEQYPLPDGQADVFVLQDRVWETLGKVDTAELKEMSGLFVEHLKEEQEAKDLSHALPFLNPKERLLALRLQKRLSVITESLTRIDVPAEDKTVVLYRALNDFRNDMLKTDREVIEAIARLSATCHPDVQEWMTRKVDDQDGFSWSHDRLFYYSTVETDVKNRSLSSSRSKERWREYTEYIENLTSFFLDIDRFVFTTPREEVAKQITVFPERALRLQKEWSDFSLRKTTSEPGIEVEDEALNAELEPLVGQYEWKKEFLKVIPPDWHTLIDSIHFKRELKSPLTPTGFVGGVFDADLGGRIELSVTDGRSGSQLFDPLLFHELGHAIDFNETPTRAFLMRLSFFQAVTKESNRASVYAAHCYADQGGIRGLEEDFAESLMNFLAYPNMLREIAPERYATMETILSQFYPDIHIDDVREMIMRRARIVEQKPEYIREKINTWDELKALFPQLHWQPLAIITQNGPPDSRVYARRGDITVCDSYNEYGQWIRRRVTDGSTEVLSQNCDLNSVDAEGRPESFELNGKRVHLFYHPNEPRPYYITIPDDGVGFEYRLTSDGRVEESLQQLDPQGQSIAVAQTRISYRLSPEGKLQDMQGMLGGVLMFQALPASSIAGNVYDRRWNKFYPLGIEVYSFNFQKVLHRIPPVDDVFILPNPREDEARKNEYLV